MLIIYIHNIKTKDDIADYEYHVMVNTGNIAKGKIKKHKRSDGWAKLVKRIAEQHLSTNAESGQ